MKGRSLRGSSVHEQTVRQFRDLIVHKQKLLQVWQWQNFWQFHDAIVVQHQIFELDQRHESFKFDLLHPIVLKIQSFHHQIATEMKFNELPTTFESSRENFRYLIAVQENLRQVVAVEKSSTLQLP
jgi:hypothetical protein